MPTLLLGVPKCYGALQNEGVGNCVVTMAPVMIYVGDRFDLPFINHRPLDMCPKIEYVRTLMQMYMYRLTMKFVIR